MVASGMVAQDYLESIHSVYDDDLTEWDIYSHEEEGKLEITWKIQRDLTEWTYELGDRSGIIRQKWQNSDNEYELRTDDGYYVKMKIRWNNDYSEWRIESDSATFIWMSKEYNDANEWGAKSEEFGEFYMYTQEEDDARDWIIEDYFNEDLLPEKIACMFVTLIRVITSR